MRALAILLLLFSFGCGEETKAPGERAVLVVGTEPEFKRFETKNADGELVGLDMDMIRMMAEDLDMDLRIEEMEFGALIPSLLNGKIDLIISGMTATAARAKKVKFSEPYFHTKLCLLVNVKAGITNASEADGKTIVVKQNTTGQANAPRLFPNSKIEVLQAEADCANLVASGRAAAFLYDHLSIFEAAKKHSKTTKALYESLSEEPYAMAMRLNDTDLHKRVNEFVRNIHKDGRLDKLKAKWMGDIPNAIR